MWEIKAAPDKCDWYRIDSSGKEKRPASDKPPPARKSKPNFKVGDYVSLHKSKLDKYHIPCRVVRIFGEKCLLYCRKGVLNTDYSKSQLMAVSSDWSISGLTQRGNK